MRILHVIDSFGLYGAEAVLLNLAEEQKLRGDTPTVLSIGNLREARKSIETEASKRNIECIAFRMTGGLNLLGARRVLSLARDLGVDVIHSHGYKADILLGCFPKWLRQCPIIATLHGWTAKKTLSKMGIYRLLDQLFLRRLDAVVSVNQKMMLSRTMRKLKSGQAFWIPNGIATSRPTAEELQRIGNEPLAKRVNELRRAGNVVIGAIGRLSIEKNFISLIEAIHHLNQLGFRVGAAILGDGPEAEPLQRAITARGLNGVVLLEGFVPDAGKYLELFDLLVIPSLTEGLPITLLEAMSAKVPVVATRVGDIEAALGGIGVVVDPGDSLKLANGIQVILDNLTHYKLQAITGAQRVTDNYSAATMAASYAKVYEAVCRPVSHQGRQLNS